MNNYQAHGRNYYVSDQDNLNHNYALPQNGKKIQIAKQIPNIFQYKENPIQFNKSTTKKDNFNIQNSNQHEVVYQKQQIRTNTHSITNLKTQLSNPNINSHYNVCYQSLNQITCNQRNINERQYSKRQSQNLQFKDANKYKKASNSNYSEQYAGIQVYKLDRLSTLEIAKPQINKREEFNVNIQKTAASSAVTHNKGENYILQGVAGKGTFGIVYLGKDIRTGQKIAYKKVVQHKKYKNRQLQILEQVKHPNIIKMRESFITSQDSEDYLNIIMDYYPQCLNQCIKKRSLNSHQIKVIAYQVFKGLQYLSSKGIAHRDIKPHNILIDRKSQKSVICDFGSAKKLVNGQKNLAYICSRCFRAAELIFGATQYTSQVDVWSMGCILFEMVNGKLPFVANSQGDLFIEMVKMLGTPTQKDAFQMNSNFDKVFFNRLPKKDPLNLASIIKTSDSQLIDLISRILVYSPKRRLTPTQVLNHPYFYSVRENNQYKLNKNETSKSINILPSHIEKNINQKHRQHVPNYTDSFNQVSLIPKQKNINTFYNYSQKSYHKLGQSNSNQSQNNFYQKDRQFPALQRLSQYDKNSTEAKKGTIFRPYTQRESPKKLVKPLPPRYLSKY